MTKTKAKDTLIAGLNRWQVAMGEAFNECRAALEQEDFERAAAIMTSVTQSQAKVSLNLKSAMRKGGWLSGE